MGCLVALVSAGSYNFAVLVLLGFFWKWTFLPSLIAAIALWNNHHQLLMYLSKAAMLWCVFLCVSLPAYLAGSQVLDLRIASSKQQAEKIVALLYDYHAKNDRYPKSLDKVPAKDENIQLPSLANSGFYQSDGYSFVLILPDPTRPFSYWSYDSKFRNWEYVD